VHTYLIVGKGGVTRCATTTSERWGRGRWRGGSSRPAAAKSAGGRRQGTGWGGWGGRQARNGTCIFFTPWWEHPPRQHLMTTTQRAKGEAAVRHGGGPERCGMRPLWPRGCGRGCGGAAGTSPPKGPSPLPTATHHWGFHRVVGFDRLGGGQKTNGRLSRHHPRPCATWKLHTHEVES
jgi:hypothetical protein